MTIQDLTWLLTIGSIIGGQLIIYKNRKGYALWIIVNFLWVIFFMHKVIYSSAVLFAVYLVQSIWGYVKWKK